MKYSVKAAALATGVSESRLRTWERRYGIPSPGRSASGRRQYNDSDIEVIRRMAALVGAGIPASEAAAAALSEEAIPTSPSVAELHPAVDAIAQAGERYDERALLGLLDSVVSELGWNDAVDEAVLPALRQLGRAWHENAIVSANEHFTTELIRRRLATAISEVKDLPDPAQRIVLACPQDERHDIGLLSLQLLLLLRGIRVVYLGSDVPAPDLALAVIQTNADALCLAATLESAGASAGRAVRELLSARVSVKIFVGGPAFSSNGSISTPGVRLPVRVRDAADAIQRALTPA